MMRGESVHSEIVKMTIERRTRTNDGVALTKREEGGRIRVRQMHTFAILDERPLAERFERAVAEELLADLVLDVLHNCTSSRLIFAACAGRVSAAASGVSRQADANRGWGGGQVPLKRRGESSVGKTSRRRSVRSTGGQVHGVRRPCP